MFTNLRCKNKSKFNNICDGANSMKVLFLTSRLPFPPIGGDKLRTFNFIKYLNERHDLTILSFIEDEVELKWISDYRHYYNKLITIKLPVSRSYRNCVKGLFSRIPLQIHYYFSKEMQEAVEKELQNGYDTLFCHLIRMAQYLQKDNHIHKVVDFTDAISLNYKRSNSYRKGLFSFVNLIEAKRVSKYEFDSINRADIAIFISNVDGNYLKNQHNKDKIKIVSNGVDLNKFEVINSKYHTNRIVFLGNMRTFPNSDAVEYFVKEIFPLLKQTIPNLEFHIVGNQPTKNVLKMHDNKNIFVTGFVDSVSSYLKNAAIMVAPMRVGAGIQNKILESLAVGTPVVTTEVGAEGLDEDKLTIANTPQEFYSKAEALIKNRKLRNEMAVIGRKYVENNFQWSKKLYALDEYIKNVNTNKELNYTEYGAN